jgi:tetratricopeptide (TPR) repeat protein
LDAQGKPQEALIKLQQASMLESSAHVQALIGMVYAKQSKWQEALAALERAEKIDPRFDVTYLYRGNIYEAAGDKASAAAQYQRAIALNPVNQAARDALVRVSQ